MLGRIQGIAAAIVCAGGVICCGGSNEQAAPAMTDEAPSEPRPRVAETSAAPLPAPSEDAGLMFDAVAPGGEPAMAFLVDDDGALVRFPIASPALAKATAITGLAPDERVVGIDIRPADGKLYALASSSRLYVIDRATSAATAISEQPFTPALAGQAFGFDADPSLDAFRVVTELDQSLRLDPTTGAVVDDRADAMLAFAPGDANAGQSPAVVGAAYTKDAVLFGIDATRDLLVKLPSPNDGTVTTVGSLGIVVADDALGFDIRSDGKAYAAIRVGDENGLYEIDLATGEAKLAGAIPHGKALHGLALDP